MPTTWPVVPLAKGLTERKEFIRIDDLASYKRCRVQLHTQGIVLRDSVSGAEIKTKEQQVCSGGDFLVAEIDAKVGGYGIVPDDLAGAIVSGHYFLFSVDTGVLNRRFLDYYVRTAAFFEQVKARGSTNYAAIRSDDVLSYHIPLPPLAKQQRIVARIDALAARIDEARGLRREAAEGADVIVDQSVDLAFQGLEDTRTVRLASYAEKIGSGSTPNGGRFAYPSSGVPFIRSMNVRMREFQWDGIAYINRDTHQTMQGTQVQPRDVLLNITGASIGRVACAPDDLAEANVNQHVTIIRPSAGLDSRYLMYWMSQPKIQDLINSSQKGATRQGFTKKQIQMFDVPLPLPSEQHRIVAYLDALQAKVDDLKRLQEETAQELGVLLPSVLDRAFKGEL